MVAGELGAPGEVAVGGGEQGRSDERYELVADRFPEPVGHGGVDDLPGTGAGRIAGAARVAFVGDSGLPGDDGVAVFVARTGRQADGVDLHNGVVGAVDFEVETHVEQV